jgi:hypothetical protein
VQTRKERLLLAATSNYTRNFRDDFTASQEYFHRIPWYLHQHDRIAAMSPVEPTSDASSAQSLTLPELIFSCGICQATVSEVYATPESNKGFHSGSGDDDGIVTRLWIAECSHVSCGKHLAGGGVLRRVNGTNTTDRLDQLHHSTRMASNRRRPAHSAFRLEMRPGRTCTVFAAWTKVNTTHQFHELGSSVRPLDWMDLRRVWML